MESDPERQRATRAVDYEPTLEALSERLMQLTMALGCVCRLLNKFFLVCLVGLQISANVSNAQTTLCACTPSSYSFILNFALTCPETTIARSAGITDIQCTTTPDVALDTVTAEAYSIQFVELDQNRLILKSLTVDTPVPNGGTVTFESYIASPQGEGRVPGSLEVGITARDATTSTVYQQWVLQYSNSCTDYPVLSQGEQIGWTSLGNLTPPAASFCPAVSGPTPPTPSNSTVAPVSPAPGTVAPSPPIRMPSLSPITYTSFSPTVGSSTTGPTHQPVTSSEPHTTDHPTAYCPPFISSKAKGKGKGKGFSLDSAFDRAYIPSDCYHFSSKSSKSKKAKAPKVPKSKSKGAKGSKGPDVGKGKGYYEWPSQQPFPHSGTRGPASPPYHHGAPTPASNPPGIVPTTLPLSPSSMVPGSTPQPSWLFNGPSVITLVPSALTDDLQPGVPTASSAPATAADDSTSQPPNVDDNPSIPVESAEPPPPTQSPGASAAPANQAAAIAGIVMAGFVVTVIATTLLFRTSQRPKYAQQPPTLVGGSMTGRMSTGETLSVESRPSSGGAAGHRLTSSRAGGARRASTIATGFQEGPILEETMMVPPPSPESTETQDVLGTLPGAGSIQSPLRDPHVTSPYLQFPHYYASPSNGRSYMQAPSDAEYLSNRWGRGGGDDSDASPLMAD